jgi:hypothetical protein
MAAFGLDERLSAREIAGALAIGCALLAVDGRMMILNNQAAGIRPNAAPDQPT